MSLSPGFVPWAAIAATQVFIAGGILWLVRPEPVRAVLVRAQLGDAVALWLCFAAGYHLVFLPAFRAVLGPPWALWSLCGVLGAYGLTARLRGPRMADWRFAGIVLAWALVLAAGQGYLDQTVADAARLRDEPRTVLRARPETLRPLWRVELLSRVADDDRQATAAVLRVLLTPPLPDDAALAAFRLGRLPRLLDAYAQETARLRTYLWLQIGLLAVVLLVWGLGPRREPDVL